MPSHFSLLTFSNTWKESLGGVKAHYVDQHKWDVGTQWAHARTVGTHKFIIKAFVRVNLVKM